jgi:hypothetical protein
MDQVCNSSGCRTIPRRVCNPVQCGHEAVLVANG